MSERKRFQLFRSMVLADYITLANAAFGTSAVFFCLNHMTEPDVGWITGAFVSLPLAFMADAVDGIVARRGKRQSPYGGDLDSLADTISFGLAPAVLGFTLGLRGVWDALILVFFVCCGIGRLARYNVTAELLTTDSGKVSHFEGTPIPTSMSLVFVLLIAYAMGDVGDTLWGGAHRFLGAGFHPLVLMYAVSGSLMVSTIRIPKP